MAGLGFARSEGRSPSAGRCPWAACPGCPVHGARPVAALVLIVEPGRHHRIDPGRVAAVLGLTPPESRVAVGLAEGKSVRDIAKVTCLSENTLDLGG